VSKAVNAVKKAGVEMYHHVIAPMIGQAAHAAVKMGGQMAAKAITNNDANLTSADQEYMANKWQHMTDVAAVYGIPVPNVELPVKTSDVPQFNQLTAGFQEQLSKAVADGIEFMHTMMAKYPTDLNDNKLYDSSKLTQAEKDQEDVHVTALEAADLQASLDYDTAARAAGTGETTHIGTTQEGGPTVPPIVSHTMNAHAAVNPHGLQTKSKPTKFVRQFPQTHRPPSTDVMCPDGKHIVTASVQARTASQFRDGYDPATPKQHPISEVAVARQTFSDMYVAPPTATAPPSFSIYPPDTGYLLAQKALIPLKTQGFVHLAPSTSVLTGAPPPFDPSTQLTPEYVLRAGVESQPFTGTANTGSVVGRVNSTFAPYWSTTPDMTKEDGFLSTDKDFWIQPGGSAPPSTAKAYDGGILLQMLDKSEATKTTTVLEPGNPIWSEANMKTSVLSSAKLQYDVELVIHARGSELVSATSELATSAHSVSGRVPHGIGVYFQSIGSGNLIYHSLSDEVAELIGKDADDNWNTSLGFIQSHHKLRLHTRLDAGQWLITPLVWANQDYTYGSGSAASTAATIDFGNGIGGLRGNGDQRGICVEVMAKILVTERGGQSTVADQMEIITTLGGKTTPDKMSTGLDLYYNPHLAHGGPASARKNARVALEKSTEGVGIARAAITDEAQASGTDYTEAQAFWVANSGDQTWGKLVGTDFISVACPATSLQLMAAPQATTSSAGWHHALNKLVYKCAESTDATNYNNGTPDWQEEIKSLRLVFGLAFNLHALITFIGFGSASKDLTVVLKASCSQFMISEPKFKTIYNHATTIASKAHTAADAASGLAATIRQQVAGY